VMHTESDPFLSKPTWRPSMGFWFAVAGVVFCSLTGFIVLAQSAGAYASGGGFQDHIVLMPAAFVLLAPLGAIAWRVLRSALGLSHALVKAAHGLMMSAALIIGAVGVAMIWDAHNQTAAASEAQGYSPHFQSAHSWIGAAALLTFTANCLLAIFIFALPFASPSLRAAFRPVHIFLGGAAVVLTLVAVLMGILSYAARGNNATAKDIEYKLAALLVAALLVSLGGVFYSSPQRLPHDPSRDD